ncbi:Response regulator protein VraR [Stieleria bergensis]|uniref:Response regulator protein VraR n=1 Tax=Stieleria bergensis TaxID=2528025 RepID=A0A517SRM9_9BACT|nr:MAG: hypothetical protein CBB71_09815 [Rhodopirellula sp. TMED11]QDT58784.1 Response regulator protein VraR [Planctomycetes bacterium SV_7m_r]
MSFKTIVIDDHEAARLGLAVMLEGSSINIAGSTASAEEGLATLETEKFDAALVDVQMSQTDGLALLTKLRELHPELPVIFISAYDYPIYIARAVANGALGYVLKSDPIGDVEKAIQHAVVESLPHPEGRLHRIKRKMTESIPASDLPAEFPITPREAQVLRHIAFGLSNREIAASLRISVETVKEHVQNILRKTGAADRTDVAVRAVRLGFND